MTSTTKQEQYAVFAELMAQAEAATDKAYSYAKENGLTYAESMKELSYKAEEYMEEDWQYSSRHWAYEAGDWASSSC